MPYGVYDLADNSGWVSVGITSDTAQFAVNVRRSLDWTKYQRTYRIWALDASDSQLKLLIYFDYIRAIRCHTLSPRPIRAEE